MGGGGKSWYFTMVCRIAHEGGPEKIYLEHQGGGGGGGLPKHEREKFKNHHSPLSA